MFKYTVVIYCLLLGVIVSLGVSAFALPEHKWLMYTFLLVVFSFWPALVVLSLVIWGYIREAHNKRKEKKHAGLLGQHDSKHP